MPAEGLAIVFGNELIGIDASVMDECDGFVMVRGGPGASTGAGWRGSSPAVSGAGMRTRYLFGSAFRGDRRLPKVMPYTHALTH
jgi:hypothetical protein